MLTALERYLKSYYNIASKFVWSNSTARACFIFLLCTLMTSPNISLKKKIFRRVENVIKQLVPTSAMRSLRYEALGKFREHSRSESCSRLRIFRALQTSRVLHNFIMSIFIWLYTIIQYISLIIKTAEWYFIDFITSKLMILTSDGFRFITYLFFS